MKTLFSAWIICISSFTLIGKTLPYQNPKLPIDKRVNDLLSRMTLEEKIAELNLIPYYEQQDSEVRKNIRSGKVGALLKANGATLNRSLQEEAIKHSRLGIPLIFHEDVIHGYRTITPIPLAESCSWDREIVRKGAELAAKEATAAGIQLTYAPMVDISNDPRWGRIMETSGEDAFLGSELAIARVKGFQGTEMSAPQTMMACVKHFAGYGYLRGGRDYQNTDFSFRELMEVYVPPFQAAVNAGVGSVMCAYTSYDAEPITMNRFINHDILREQMNFSGLLISDWTTLSHAISEGAATDGKEAAKRGINSGIDMDMTSQQYIKWLKQLADEKSVSVEAINNAVKRSLTAKFQMGLFDDPYKYFNTDREQKELLSIENQQTACQSATASMVLLKNDKETLPLKENTLIALVGPFATEQNDLLGSWTMKGQANEVISVEQGMKKIYTESSLISLGCKQNEITPDYIKQAVNTAQQANTIVVCLGESASRIGEGVTTAKISLPNDQIQLLKALNQTGKKIVTVLFNGRPLVLDEVLTHSDALLEAWYPGTMGGQAVALLLSGKENPSGKLTQTFPRHAGQIPIAYNERRTFSLVQPNDIPQNPQFVFGYGLSYNQYEYSDLKVDKDSIKAGETIEVSVKVKNRGKYNGREVVQLYVRDEVATIIPREKELKGFQSVYLKPGEEQTIRFKLPQEAFMIYNNKMKKVIEPGSFQIMAGANSEELLKTRIEITQAKKIR